MGFHAPAPVTTAQFGNGADAASSTILGELQLSGSSVIVHPLLGMGSGNITLSNPAAAKAVLVGLAAKVAANEGFDAVDLYNVPGSSADPKVGLNEETGIVSLSGPTPVLTMTADMFPELIGAFADLGI